MAREIVYPPLVHWKSLLKGVFGGSLLVGGLANNYGIAIQLILALFGLLLLLDGVMVSGRGVFIVICLLSGTVAGAVTLVLSVTNLAAPWLIIAFIGGILLYVWKYLKLGGMAIQEKEGKEAQE